jgi:hypothetical protein
MFVTATVFLLMLIGLSTAAWWHDSQLFNGLMETVKALVMVAAGFWIGSSNSSQKKDEAAAADSLKKTEALAASAPVAPVAPVVTTTKTEGQEATVTTTTEPKP